MMYATGTPLSKIAEATGIKLGTLCAESARKGWTQDRQKVQELVTERAAEAQEIVLTMKEKAEQWPSRVAEIANKGLKVLELEQPATLNEVNKLVGVLDKVDRVARRSYGLDEDANKASNTIVNLGFLTGFADDPLPPEKVVISEPLLHE